MHLNKNGDTESGIRVIHPFNNDKSVATYCDQDTEGGGWTTILNRDSGKANENFQRNYADYESGFGHRNGDFWIGLQTIHQLTTSPCTELRIDMETYKGKKYVAKYSTFKVGSEEEGYVLKIDGFSSIPKFKDDLKAMANGMKFTTIDKDQDKTKENCAKLHNGGWWHNKCFQVKLTGSHFNGKHAYAKGIHWGTLTTHFKSLKKVAMKVRPRPLCKN